MERSPPERGLDLFQTKAPPPAATGEGKEVAGTVKTRSSKLSKSDNKESSI